MKAKIFIPVGIILYLIACLFNQTYSQSTAPCIYVENARMNLQISATTQDVRFAVTYPTPQAYVEVFATKNGVQNIATNIVSSEMYDGGQYVYSYIVPASTYSEGDVITYRFYAYEAGKPGTFLPGPSEGVWSSPVTYKKCGNGQTSKCTYVDNPNMSLNIAGNGDVTYTVNYSAPQAYVEVFATKNGEQNIATNIVSSQSVNNGVYTYSYTVPASAYSSGDVITYRFYAYEAGKPGTFLPGPGENVWSNPVTYKKCGVIVYVSTTGSDSNPGTIAAPVASVFKGLGLAQTLGATEVRVATGTYSWVVTPTSYSGLNLVNGISLLGGYSSDFSSRSLAIDHLSKLTIVYDGNSFYFKYGAPAIVYASNITNPTVLEGFSIVGGMSTDAASGLVVTNSNSNFIVRNNNISNNSYQISCPWSSGGNIALINSSVQVYNNTAINGSRKDIAPYDIFISGPYSDGSQANIHDNLFTCSNSVFGTAYANFHDNTFNTTCPSPSPAAKISVINNKVVIDNSIEDAQVEVYNLLGQLMVKGNSQDVSLSSLPSGPYIISVVTGGSRETKKIIIQ